jgi:hypothetical protein
MTFTLTLTQEQLNIIAAGLCELPFKVSASVIKELQNQIQVQSKPQSVPAATLDAAEQSTQVG